MGGHKPRVSIGIPVFNGEKYLEAALDSILAQTHSDFEVIISDNASSDRTPEICTAYAAKDRRIRYVRNPENLGASFNHNRVFELSSGEYFKWASHDDAIAPDFLLKCVDVLDQHPSVVLCHSLVKIINDVGHVLKTYDVRLNTDSPKPQERFGDLICTRHMFFQFFGLIRAKALKAILPMGDYAASDTVFLGRLALLGRFYEIPEHLFFSRSHAEQSAKTLPAHLHGAFDRLSKTFGVRPRPHADWFEPTKKGQIQAPEWKVYVANYLAGPLPPAEWFDPTKEGRIAFPYWRILLEHFIGVRHAGLRGVTRGWCYVHLGRWLGRNLHRMVRDLITAALQCPGFLFRAPIRGRITQGGVKGDWR